MITNIEIGPNFELKPHSTMMKLCKIALFSVLAVTGASGETEDSDAFALKLAYYNETKLEADTSVLELETTLDSENTTTLTTTGTLDDGRTLDSTTLDSSTLDSSSTGTNDSVTSTNDVITKMDDQLAKVLSAAQKILTLEGEVRDAEIAEWNANHDRIMAKLFELLQKEAENGISDDLAPILEQIREAFQLVNPAAAASGP